MDVIGVITSLALQYGVPLEKLCEKLIGVQFEPSGYTGEADRPFAESLVDYIFRYLRDKYVNVKDNFQEIPAMVETAAVYGIAVPPNSAIESDKVCVECGNLMQQTGNCRTCIVCGAAGGCV